MNSKKKRKLFYFILLILSSVWGMTYGVNYLKDIRLEIEEKEPTNSSIKQFPIPAKNKNSEKEDTFASFFMTCSLTYVHVWNDNCTGSSTGSFSTDWKLSIISSNAPDTAISYKRNSETVQSHILTGTTDTLTITGVPADGGLYDTLIRVRLSNTDNMTPYDQVYAGEVEDYVLRVECQQIPCLTIATEVN